MVITILIGFAAGIIGGMGVGGGVILIPLITLFEGVNQKIAQSVNLLYFIPTAACAVAVYIKNKNIQLKSLISMMVFGMVGGVLGSMLAVKIHSVVLGKMFGVFLIILSIREFILFKKSKKT